MPPFEPPDPVTAGYVGVSCALVGGIFRGLKEALPKQWRAASVPWVLLAVALAGLNALVVWGRAGVGWLTQTAAFMPESTDALGFVSGVAGLVTLLGVILGLWIRFGRPKKRIDLDRFVTIVGCIGIGVGLVLWLWVQG